jgi:hypothetical protein
MVLYLIIVQQNQSYYSKQIDDKKEHNHHVEDRKVPTRAVKPNVRQSPKPASWNGDQGKLSSKPQSFAEGAKPLKPVPRGKPIQKPKKVCLVRIEINNHLFFVVLCK